MILWNGSACMGERGGPNPILNGKKKHFQMRGIIIYSDNYFPHLQKITNTHPIFLLNFTQKNE